MARRTTGLIASPTSSASIWDRQGRRSVFATGEASMAATGMPNLGASFVKAAYKLDLLNRAPPMTHLTNDSSLGSERAPPLTPTLVSMPSGRELGVADELKSIPGVH